MLAKTFDGSRQNGTSALSITVAREQLSQIRRRSQLEEASALTLR
jgi:hypothetical protein